MDLNLSWKLKSYVLWNLCWMCVGHSLNPVIFQPCWKYLCEISWYVAIFCKALHCKDLASREIIPLKALKHPSIQITFRECAVSYFWSTLSPDLLFYCLQDIAKLKELPSHPTQITEIVLSPSLSLSTFSDLG